MCTRTIQIPVLSCHSHRDPIYAWSYSRRAAGIHVRVSQARALLQNDPPPDVAPILV